MAMNLAVMLQRARGTVREREQLDLNKLLEQAKAKQRPAAAKVPRSKKQTGLTRVARGYLQAPKQQAGFSTLDPLYAWHEQGERYLAMLLAWPSQATIGAKGLGSGQRTPRNLLVGSYKGKSWFSDGYAIYWGTPEIVERYLQKGGKLRDIDVKALGELPAVPKWYNGDWEVRYVANLGSMLNVFEEGQPARVQPISIPEGGPHEATIELRCVDGTLGFFNPTLLAAAVASVGGPPAKLVLRVDKKDRNMKAGVVGVQGPNGLQSVLMGHRF